MSVGYATLSIKQKLADECDISHATNCYELKWMLENRSKTISKIYLIYLIYLMRLELKQSANLSAHTFGRVKFIRLYSSVDHRHFELAASHSTALIRNKSHSQMRTKIKTKTNESKAPVMWIIVLHCITLDDYTRTHLCNIRLFSHSIVFFVPNAHCCHHGHLYISCPQMPRCARTPLHPSTVSFGFELAFAGIATYIFQWQIVVCFSSVLFIAMSTSLDKRTVPESTNYSPDKNSIRDNFTYCVAVALHFGQTAAGGAVGH